MDQTTIIIGGTAVLALAIIPAIKAATPLFPYAYTNARLRAMRSELLKDDDYEELLKKPYNEVLYSLGQKNYPDLSQRLEADYTYASVETAFRSSLIATLAKVARISPKQSQPFLKVLLSKYDIQLIESVVRLTKAKYSFRKDIFHATEVFSEQFLFKDNPTIEDLHNELKGTVYDPIITKHLEELTRGKFKAFEEELDLLHFRRLLKAAATKEANEYARTIIDHHNTSLILKGERALIPGGKLPLAELQGTKSIQELSAKLQARGYEAKQEKPELLERDLRRQLKRKAEHYLQKNPLSEASIIGYLILKNTEIRSLNILLKMKYHDFPEEAIREVNLR